jgi:hydrogenase maturation protease
VDEPLAYVVGIGSPHGDDRFGWEVVSRLLGVLPRGVRAITVSDPLAVADVPPGCKLLVVVDACRGAGSAGSVHCFAWPDPRLAMTPIASSHGIGLASALTIAGALGRLPPRVVVLAVEGESAQPGRGLSAAVGAAVLDVAGRVLEEIAAGTRLAVG